MRNTIFQLLLRTAFIGAILILVELLNRNNNNFFLVLSFILAINLMNHILRFFAWSKSYFMNRFNFLTVKANKKPVFDLSKDILFEKFVEVLPNAGLNIRKTDPITGNIFATTPYTFLSNGENIYISMKEVNGKTIVDFSSASFGRSSSFMAHKDNYDRFMLEFEKSLTI